MAPKGQPPRKLSGKRTIRFVNLESDPHREFLDGIWRKVPPMGQHSQATIQMGHRQRLRPDRSRCFMMSTYLTNTLSSLPPALPHGKTPIRIADLFKIGIGPSSSHTIGPMKAAACFVRNLGPKLKDTTRLTATAFGSLAWTGIGHATDKALVLGLSGESPDTIDPDKAVAIVVNISNRKRLRLSPEVEIDFDPKTDVMFDKIGVFERHPNAMRFQAWDSDGNMLADEIWFSVGGGFVVRDGEPEPGENKATVPFPYGTANELLALADQANIAIADLVLANETAVSSRRDITDALDRIADAMLACIDRGLSISGKLPGNLGVSRRARLLFERLSADSVSNQRSPHEIMEYVSAFALAVNEENAAGGRVVTAPTNGAAGVMPAVMRYYRDFCVGATQQGIRSYLLVATAIGGIIKRNASISGAEVGCQGEIGSAAAMAAAGLAAALGATNNQIENAAEIAMEHHLGMTCDPVGGFVQIPCIERNAFGAIKAITAAALALRGTGDHIVSLDQVIETMRQTGQDMQSKYKETSRGGLAVNVPEC